MAEDTQPMDDATWAAIRENNPQIMSGNTDTANSDNSFTDPPPGSDEPSDSGSSRGFSPVGDVLQATEAVREMLR
jgi:hypothetical protein